MRLLILSCEYLNDDKIGSLLHIFDHAKIEVVGAVVCKTNAIVETNIAKKIRQISNIRKKLKKRGLRKAIRYVNRKLYYGIQQTAK